MFSFRYKAAAKRAAEMSRRENGVPGGPGCRTAGLLPQTSRTRARLQQIPWQNGEKYTNAAQRAKAKVSWGFQLLWDLNSKASDNFWDFIIQKKKLIWFNLKNS